MSSVTLGMITHVTLMPGDLKLDKIILKVYTEQPQIHYIVHTYTYSDKPNYNIIYIIITPMPYVTIYYQLIIIILESDQWMSIV